MATTVVLADITTLATALSITCNATAAPAQAPNSHIPVEWEDANGNVFLASYDYMNDAIRSAAALSRAAGVSGIVEDAVSKMSALITALGTAPYDGNDLAALVNGLAGFTDGIKCVRMAK